MSAETIGILLGPAGALMLALLGLASVVKLRWLVPAYVYEGAEKRIGMLDEENDRLSETIRSQSENDAETKALVARLEERLVAMTSEAERLRQEVVKLQARVDALSRERSSPSQGIPGQGG